MKTVAMLLVFCLLLTGCSAWTEGQYVSITPHTQSDRNEEDEAATVSNYEEAYNALAQMVDSGVQSGILSVSDVDAYQVKSFMERAVEKILSQHPVGAYAVENLTFELGTTRGSSAVAVTISYNHNRSEIAKIQHVDNAQQMQERIGEALCQCTGMLVMQVEDYRDTDFMQLVRDYADANPSQVMEIPVVTANLYPESGAKRVVELIFTYQTSTEALRSMQSYVEPVFSSASLYVSGEGEQLIKFDQLYSFLMERNDYKVETSLTPAYSLLRHGVGDSKAFAVVYTAMCRRSGLDCQTIFGTRKGDPWYWNILCLDGVYYHVDLLQSHKDGTFRIMSDADMSGYVWDYSAYPVCEPEVEDNLTA